MHDYTHAIMGIIYPLAAENALKDIKTEEIRNEVLGFKRVLQELNINVIEINTTGNIREKLMMEDLAIICHGIAVIPKDFSSPALNVNSKLLQKTLVECGLTVIVQEPHSTAKLSPADVLFTGREFFVGISDYTNENGASFIADSFPEFPCTPIKMPPDAFSLKKHITVAGNDILTMCENEVGKTLLKKIEREATYTYKTLTVPILEAANCVFVNDTLMHKGIEDIGDPCFKVFCDKIDFPRRSLKFTELTKIMLDPSSLVLLTKLF
ncbi:unnamed protein product [Arctia plantaginis]|uniref:Dimethylargininase n=1 Tax=Arctia plantaginis TaxID=874455 RepID=A0A8S0Z1U7_ARCPL|nr:unnamed protein product [Arctia plantaginis]